MNTIYPGMRVHFREGGAAHVVEVLVDVPTWTDSALVVDVNGYMGPDVLVPLTRVWLVDEHVHLELTAREAAALPPFDPQRCRAEHNLCNRAVPQERLPHLAHSGLAITTTRCAG